MIYKDKDGDDCELVIKCVSIINWEDLTKAEQCKAYCSKIVCKTNPCKKYNQHEKR